MIDASTANNTNVSLAFNVDLAGFSTDGSAWEADDGGTPVAIISVNAAGPENLSLELASPIGPPFNLTCTNPADPTFTNGEPLQPPFTIEVHGT